MSVPTWIPRSPDWMTLASTGYLHNPHHTTVPAPPEVAKIIFILFSACTHLYPAGFLWLLLSLKIFQGRNISRGYGSCDIFVVRGGNRLEGVVLQSLILREGCGCIDCLWPPLQRSVKPTNLEIFVFFSSRI